MELNRAAVVREVGVAPPVVVITGVYADLPPLMTATSLPSIQNETGSLRRPFNLHVLSN